ncbi:MAG: methyltransferase, partial [Deltaproteobacteria bacterium]|nr:methyltransferase [Deltaproteobacteria bacterium]
MKTPTAKSRLPDLIGWVAILLFAGIYAVELLPHHGPPVTVRWIEKSFGTSGLILLNILVVLGFLALLPYRRPTRKAWRSHGAFFAFVIALMTEMFGWPLFVFLASPLVEIPSLAHGYFRAVGHWVASAGTAVSLLGVVLIAVGWRKIHRAETLVTDGVYKYIRHPQYTGIFLFTLGWLVHYPTAITLVLWPILMIAYVWLARLEEK